MFESINHQIKNYQNLYETLRARRCDTTSGRLIRLKPSGSTDKRDPVEINDLLEFAQPSQHHHFLLTPLSKIWISYTNSAFPGLEELPQCIHHFVVALPAGQSPDLNRQQRLIRLQILVESRRIHAKNIHDYCQLGHAQRIDPPFGMDKQLKKRASMTPWKEHH